MSAAGQVPLRGLVAGAAVAVALGVYSVPHQPTGRDFVLYGFESAASWKNALTLVVAVLLIAQAALGFKLAGIFGLRATTRPWLLEFSSPARHSRRWLFASRRFPLRLGSRLWQRQPRYNAAFDPRLRRVRLCRRGPLARSRRANPRQRPARPLGKCCRCDSVPRWRGGGYRGGFVVHAARGDTTSRRPASPTRGVD